MPIAKKNLQDYSRLVYSVGPQTRHAVAPITSPLTQFQAEVMVSYRKRSRLSSFVKELAA